MASVASSGASPLPSGYDFVHAESAGDPEENQWTLLRVPSSSGPSSASYLPSPDASGGSLGSSWGMIGHGVGGGGGGGGDGGGGGGGGGGYLEQSPSAASPLHLDFDQHHNHHQSAFHASSYIEHGGGAFGLSPTHSHSHPHPQGQGQGQPDGQFMPQALSQEEQNFVSGNLLFDQPLNATGMDLFPASFFESFQTQPMGQSMGGMSGGISGISQAFENFDFPITQNYQSSADVPPWNSLIYVTEDPAAAGLVSPSLSSSSHHNQLQQYQQHQQYSPSISVSVSPPASSASPKSPIINLKREASVSDRNSNRNSTTTTTTAPITIRKVRGDNARVSKKKSTFSSSTAADSSPLSSTGSNSSKGSAGASKFFIVTPDSVFQHANKPNPFECFEEQHRQSQRGRKGPLANDTKESALEVRRQGACFCCHARKVKCDKERPCRNCKKLTMQVPQVICWRFQDFQRVLFPEFIRGHFRKDEMHKFVTDNIEAFTVGGQDKPCTVELFSGKRFSATLSIRAKFFTAKTNEVLRHWHMQVVRNAVDLQSRDAAPIGLDMTESGSGGGGGGSAQQQRDELRKKTREYIQAIVGEPAYAELVTESQRHTTLPRKVLRIVQDFAARCGSPMVKRALSIYAMHHVMSQQLCLTRQTIINLAATKLVPQNQTWVTPRVLNRQIKSVIDEMLIKEMTALFEHFSKSLKPKSRREWAPCLAAFLVLCLFMESVEAAADTFVISETEIGIRSGRGYASEWKRSFALGINQEIENLPFKQFAFQFHQIYQTHSRDSGTRSFNPLVDDLCLDEHRGEMGDGVDEMVDGLRDILRVDWGELDFLTMDPPLPNGGEHPYPMDVSFNYEGRLAAKFLLSFENEKYIFGF